MRQLLLILICFTPFITLGQLKLKDVTEYYPKTKTIKNHYFVIKPEKKVYHSSYEVYRTNGQLKERGYFDHGVKTAFIKFNPKGQVLKELSDSVLTTNNSLSSSFVTRTPKIQHLQCDQSINKKIAWID